MAVELTEEQLDLLRQSFEWARAGDVTQMAQLLALGVPSNLTNGSGDTLLILAAYHRQAAMVELLLEHDADAERFNDNGQTALGAAVFRSATFIVRLLLDAGANPDTGPRSARQIAEFFALTEMQALLPSADTGSS